MPQQNSIVLSALEFDVLWESERLPDRHVAIDVPSPGRTHTERRELVVKAWDALEQRGLAERGRATSDLADQLALLASPTISIDCWIASTREIRGVAVSSGRRALLGVVDSGEVWLIPARDTALAEAAVSIAGQLPPGRGRSVSVPHDVLAAADAEADSDPERLIMCLANHGVPLSQAQTLAGMFAGIRVRGQFGARRRGRDRQTHIADRVVAFHDTHLGRFVYLVKPNSNGERWDTVAPADNHRIATCIYELLDEI